MTVRKFAVADYTIFAYTVVWIWVSLWPISVDQTYAGEFETILIVRSDWSVYFKSFAKLFGRLCPFLEHFSKYNIFWSVTIYKKRLKL